VTPDEYEHHVAELLRADGWSATVTPYVGDHGIDVIAERNGRRMGVQAKTWAGANRKVNAALVMTVYGEVMIATDAEVLPDAREVAAKLGVHLRFVPADVSPPSPGSMPATSAALTFGRVWTEHVTALQGRTLTRAGGSSNEILSVDGAGITRRTSKGRLQRIDIEIFRWAIERLIHGETVTREEINEHYEGRASSGIMLILSSLPLFEAVKLSSRQALRLVHGSLRSQ
jgi:restriction system protein